MATARVIRRRKGQDLTAQQPQGELPTLAQALQMREMEVAQAQGTETPSVTATQSQTSMGASAQGMGAQPGLSAQAMESGAMEVAEGAQARKATVKKKAPKDADIYDPRIGGYGKSMGPQESGEQAVRRIMKVKRKGR
jgi:hypothetical protein